MSSVPGVAEASAAQHPQFGRQMSIYIEAAPAVVFRYVADIRRHSEWSADPLKIRVEPGPQQGPGTTFTSVASSGGKRITGHVCVIEEEPPTRFVYECRDLFGCHRWTMTLQPEGTGTRLTQRRERLHGPLWLRLLQPTLLWPTVGRRSVGKGLATIKACLEARA